MSFPRQPSDETPNEKQKPKNDRPMPEPPDGYITDDAQINAAERRWEQCPLRDCKKNPELLYEDFYLRDIRTDRLMCSACAISTEVGYMARETLRQQEDRFFEGTTEDYVIVFAVIAAMSAVVNAVMLWIGFWFLAIFVGGAVGAFIGRTARNLTGGRVGRYSPQVAVAAVAAGAFLAPVLFWLVNAPGFGLQFLFSSLSFYLGQVFSLSILICSGTMAMAIYGIFMRRI